MESHPGSSSGPLVSEFCNQPSRVLAGQRRIGIRARIARADKVAIWSNNPLPCGRCAPSVGSTSKGILSHVAALSRVLPPRKGPEIETVRAELRAVTGAPDREVLLARLADT